MNYNSTVFSEMLAVLESPEPDASTGRPSMPAAIQPVLVPGGISRPQQVGTRFESHFVGITTTVANAGGAVNTITTLKEGIWRITGSYFWVSSVVAAPGICELRLDQAGAALGRLAAAITHPTVGGVAMIPIDTQLTLDADTAMVLAVAATGVGERTSVSIQVHCQRIA